MTKLQRPPGLESVEMGKLKISILFVAANFRRGCGKIKENYVCEHDLQTIGTKNKS